MDCSAAWVNILSYRKALLDLTRKQLSKIAAAKKKVHRKKSDREWTFVSVIERLKTIRPDKRVFADASFFQTTVPAEDQQRILNLLNIKL